MKSRKWDQKKAWYLFEHIKNSITYSDSKKIRMLKGLLKSFISEFYSPSISEYEQLEYGRWEAEVHLCKKELEEKIEMTWMLRFVETYTGILDRSIREAVIGEIHTMRKERRDDGFPEIEILLELLPHLLSLLVPAVHIKLYRLYGKKRATERNNLE